MDATEPGRPRDGRLLCVMPTFRCTAECTDCGTFSSPRDGTWLSPDAILSAIDQAAALGYDGVVFTGGEPTLGRDVLLAGIRRARGRGLLVRLVTNAHWAVDDDRAEQLLFEWACAGLGELSLSTGDQHVRFVPLDRVVAAAAAAARIGVPAAVAVEVRKGSRLTFEEVRSRLSGIPVVAFEWVWSPLAPIPLDAPSGAANRSNVATLPGCSDLFRTTTVQADGAISPCCGLAIRTVPELRLGHVLSTSIAEAERRALADPLLSRIRDEGPERILAWAASRDPRIRWEEMYAHRCHACIRLFTDPDVRRALGRD